MDRARQEALLAHIFHDDFEHLKGRRLRMTRVRVPGREICLAHIVTPSDPRIYENLALHIGVHEGEDHMGEAIGIMRLTPWETVVVAADIAVKHANVQLGFMDRFCGALIITGELEEVREAMEEVIRYFDQELGFRTCRIEKR